MARPLDLTERSAPAKPFCGFDTNLPSMFDWEISLPSLQGVAIQSSDELHSWESFSPPLIGSHTTEPVDLADLAPLPPSHPALPLPLWEIGSPSCRSFAPVSPLQNHVVPPGHDPDWPADHRANPSGIRTSCFPLVFASPSPFTSDDASHPSLHVTSHTFRWLTRHRSVPRSATISAPVSCFPKRSPSSSRIVSPLSCFLERVLLPSQVVGPPVKMVRACRFSIGRCFADITLCHGFGNLRSSFSSKAPFPPRIISQPVSTAPICHSFIG